jgi:phosphoribosylformimino-5-aminoimidazole carboxamide ribotide isomerase
MIIPAIDLSHGEAVRLYQGHYEQKTVYSRDPAGLARHFDKLGAKYLHIVDLDGAKSGHTENMEVIQKIRRTVGIPMQVGGGIRNAQTVTLYLDQLKMDRVILGTAAVRNPGFIREMISLYGAKRIVVSVDVRNGKVAAAGWLEDSGTDYLDFIGHLKQAGVQRVIVTDIAKDGTLTSPNWDMYERISGIHVLVSGGIACNEDVIKADRCYDGVIVGKAYYEGKVDLEACLRKSSPA